MTIYTCTADSELNAYLIGYGTATATFIVLFGGARIRAAWRNLRADLRKLRGDR